MRAPVLLLALVTAGCAQSDKRTASDTPVVAEPPKISARIRAHNQERAATESAAITTTNIPMRQPVLVIPSGRIFPGAFLFHE